LARLDLRLQISLYTPEILEKIFGSSETVAADYWENVLSVAATLPASLASVWLLGKVPSRSLQAVGFVVAAAAFLLVALCWAYLEKHSKTGLFLLFLLQKNASLFGVATTTFVLPNELFPRRVRASCNGLSAAAGKAGAFLGSFLFPYVYDGLSMAAVFYVCALVALAGLAATLMLLPPMPAGGEDNEDDDEREAALLSRGGKGESPTEVSALLAA
jgi:MFS family permease